jgi:hypothetical protein
MGEFAVRDGRRVLYGTVRCTDWPSVLTLFNHSHDRSHRRYAVSQPMEPHLQSVSHTHTYHAVTPHCFFCIMHAQPLHITGRHTLRPPRSLSIIIIIVLIIRYPLFLKTKPVLAADVHPVVFQLYKSTLVFLTSWLLLIPRAIRASHGELPEGEPV